MYICMPDVCMPKMWLIILALRMTIFEEMLSKVGLLLQPSIQASDKHLIKTNVSENKFSHAYGSVNFSLSRAIKDPLIKMMNINLTKLQLAKTSHPLEFICLLYKEKKGKA